MKIYGEIKNEIRMLQAEGKNDEALKRLQKIKMLATEYDSIETELFINYCIAWFHSKNDNKEFANYYLELNNELFKDENVRNERKPEYYKYLWLYSEVNKEDISKEEYCNNFIEIYKYYKEIDDYRFSNGAIQNIIFRNGTDDEIVSFMECIINKYGAYDKLVVDMVSDCKELDNHIYIKIKKLLCLCENKVAI